MLGGFGGVFDQLLEALVVDVRGSPFGHLVPGQIMAELHLGRPAVVGSFAHNRERKWDRDIVAAIDRLRPGSRQSDQRSQGVTVG